MFLLPELILFPLYFVFCYLIAYLFYISVAYSCCSSQAAANGGPAGCAVPTSVDIPLSPGVLLVLFLLHLLF